MSADLLRGYLEKRIIYYRIFTILATVMTLMAFGFDRMPGKIVSAAVYISAVVVSYIIDEIMNHRNKRGNMNPRHYYIKACVFFAFFVAGGIFGTVPVYIYVGFIAYGTLMVIECYFLDDIFYSSRNSIFTVAFAMLTTLGLYLPTLNLTGGNITFDTMILFNYAILTLVVVLAFMLMRALVSQAAVDWSNKYNDVLYASEDIREENEKLKKLQERIEDVNNTINFQKIELTETNTALKNKNSEIRTLMDVMKTYTSSFDVETNVESLIKSVVDVKGASLCCMYIDKDIALNEEEIFKYISVQNYSPACIKKDTVKVYELLKERKKPDPIVICNNYTSNYPYFERKGCCTVAFPAYENETLYGVLIVAGEKYDFFYSGYDFYLSSVINFTSSLMADRLYLTIDDMAKKDGLTKIYNRIYFNKIYDKMLADKKKNGGTMSVMMLDIDHFKNVNDTYGHLAGDEAIKTVAKMDWDIAKKYGFMAVRFGGEEFLLIMDNTPLDRAREIAKELHENIRNNVINYEGMEIRINTSVGVSNYPETCSDLRNLFDRADKAMYYGKTHGRGRIVVDGREDQAEKLGVGDDD